MSYGGCRLMNNVKQRTASTIPCMSATIVLFEQFVTQSYYSVSCFDRTLMNDGTHRTIVDSG